MPAAGAWDTSDRRLARRGVELERGRDGTWRLLLPRPRALGPGGALTATDDGAGPPLEFAEIVWPLTAGRPLVPARGEPPPEPTATLHHLASTTRQAVVDVHCSLPWLRVGPAEPGQIRTARTSVRRLRTQLRALRPYLATPLESWDGLRELNNHLRTVRDLDIVERALPRLQRLSRGAHSATASQGVQRLLDTVAVERRRARNELWAELVHRRTSDLLDQLGEVHVLDLTPDFAAQSDRDMAATLLRDLVDAARERARGAATYDRNDLMAFRTALRRLRVVATTSVPVLGDDAHRLARRALEVQDALGPIAEAGKALTWLERRTANDSRPRLGQLTRDLSEAAAVESREHADMWRGPWERFTRRRVLRWL